MKKQIIKFEAVWCAPCKAMSEIIKQIKFPDDVEYLVFDADKDLAETMEHEINFLYFYFQD